MSTLKVGTIQDHANSNTAISIDSGGRVTTPARPMFRAFKSGTGWVDIVHNANRKIPFDTEKYDVGGCFNTSTSIFTAPITGYYHLYVYAYVHNNTGTKTLILQMGTSDPASGDLIALHQGNLSEPFTMQIHATHYFTANQSCGAYLYQSNDTVNGVYSDNTTTYSGFEGYLVG